MTSAPVVVIDNGTGYTKMGYAGNVEPSHIMPTAIADHLDKGTVQISKLQYDQLDFHIGYDAIKNKDNYNLIYPLKSGLITDWEAMEKFWHRSIYQHLRCEPDEHVFVLTEPPMNPPENREQIAEIMFETFNVKGLHIGVQAVLALYSNWCCAEDGSLQKKIGLTGTVCDSGDGVTHVIPVSDGYVIGSCIKHIPLAGRDITKFVMQQLKDRGENIPPEDIKEVAKEIKEKYGYIAKDLVKEMERYDKAVLEGGKSKFKTYTAKNHRNGETYSVDVGYEAFLGPEMFFKPEFIDAKWRSPIDEVIDHTIQACPIDTRRKLYSNIVLSGGSTTIKNFKERLQTQVQERVDNRFEKYRQMTGTPPPPIDVSVTENPFLRYSVWHGASMMAKEPGFSKAYHKREDYFEIGPSIARYNPVFFGGM